MRLFLLYSVRSISFLYEVSLCSETMYAGPIEIFAVPSYGGKEKAKNILK